jgi:G3E family GTPase
MMTYLRRSILKSAGILHNRYTSSALCRSDLSYIEKTSKSKVVPVTVLSGFLGAGKTTFLNNILMSKTPLQQRYGLIVNDMASVNIDSKFIRSQTSGHASGIDTLELQNGCICCTLAEDLMESVKRLLNSAAERGRECDHIIVECSGIAEPRKIRDIFQEKLTLGEISEVKLDTLITIVDGSVFYKLFGSDAKFFANSDLIGPDLSNKQTGLQDDIGHRNVTELLLEQVECADIVLINKCDLLADNHVELVRQIIQSINPVCTVHSCVRGQLPEAARLLGSIGGEGAAACGILDEHRQLVAAASDAYLESSCHNHDTCSHQCDSTHVAPNSTLGSSCSDPTCSDPSHNHDSVHNHNHQHAHGNHAETTAKERFGITSFVFQRRRPFHPQRFSAFLKRLANVSISSTSDTLLRTVFKSNSPGIGNYASTEGLHRFDKAEIGAQLLRTKGFVWMASSSSAAYFVSHAGQHMEIAVLGRWWADIPRAQWPPDSGSIADIEADFCDNKDIGDRRQEIVFIGQFESGITRLEALLETCLLTDEEFESYRRLSRDGDRTLRQRYFPEA